MFIVRLGLSFWVGLSILLFSFASVALSAWHLISVFAFEVSVAMFFLLRSDPKKSVMALTLFAASSVLFDAYSNALLGVTFLSGFVAYDILRLFLAVMNHPGYMQNYPMRSFFVFSASFEFFRMIFGRALSGPVITGQDFLISLFLINAVYAAMVYKKRSNRIRRYQSTL